jgi:hypothetical protein
MLIRIFIVLEQIIILYQLIILKQIKMLKFVLINVMVQCKLVLIKVSFIELIPKKRNSFCFWWNLGNAPNYYRNTFNGPDVTDRNRHTEHATFESGMAARHEASEDDNYSQPRVFYQVRRKIFISINFDFFFCRRS